MGSVGQSIPYCTAEEIKPFVDKRYLARLLSDTGQAVTGDPFSDTVKLPGLILAAGGEVESACMVGAKYTPDDLMNLEENSRMLLVRIIAGTVVNLLRQRRGVIDEKEQYAYNWASKQLDLIRKGERIFSVVSVQDARTMDHRVEDVPARVQRQGITERNLRFFGRRGYY